MHKELDFSVNVMGEEGNKHWSSCSVVAEQLSKLISEKPQGLISLEVDPGDNEPDFRERIYKQALIPLEDFYELRETESFYALTDAVSEKSCPQIVYYLDLPTVNDYYQAVEGIEESFLEKISVNVGHPR